MKSKYTWLFVLIAVTVFYLWRYRRAPDLDLSTIEVSDATGNTESLQEVLSDSSIVLFYASWCGPCLKEMRELKKVCTEFEREGIRFFCITDDSPEKLEVMRSNMPPSITFLHTNSLQSIGIYTIPAAYFVLRGTVTVKQLSALDWARKKEIIESFNTQ